MRCNHSFIVWLDFRFVKAKVGRNSFVWHELETNLPKICRKAVAVGRILLLLRSETKKCWIMTTFALNNLWTYLQGLMLSQSEREWLVRKLSEPVEKIADIEKEEPVSQTLKDLVIPDKLRRKRGCIKLTEEDLKDEHIQYLLNR